MATKKSNSTMPIDMDSNWQAESDARTLMDACVIRKDPARLKSAISLAKQKMQDYKSVVMNSLEEYSEDE